MRLAIKISGNMAVPRLPRVMRGGCKVLHTTSDNPITIQDEPELPSEQCTTWEVGGVFSLVDIYRYFDIYTSLDPAGVVD